MKKTLLAMVLVLAMALMVSPAMAGSLSLKTFNVSASSSVCTLSGNIGNGGSFGSAWNTSCASVKFGPGYKVTTDANTIGGTFGLGWNINTQGGKAGACGTFGGVIFGGVN